MRRDDVAECYEKHADGLLRFAATIVGSSDAEDVLAAAVLAVLCSSTSSVDNLRAYLYTAVLNAGRSHWRSLDRRGRRERLTAQPDFAAVIEPNLDVRVALATLSAQQRAVVHLTYWEDLTPPKVAARLGVGEGTVRRQLARARQRLAEVLQ